MNLECIMLIRKAIWQRECNVQYATNMWEYYAVVFSAYKSLLFKLPTDKIKQL